MHVRNAQCNNDPSMKDRPRRHSSYGFLANHVRFDSMPYNRPFSTRFLKGFAEDERMGFAPPEDNGEAEDMCIFFLGWLCKKPFKIRKNINVCISSFILGAHGHRYK